MNPHVKRIAAWSLIALGALAWLLHIVQAPLRFEGGLLVALAFGLPALGALVLFAERFLSREPGIDNDAVKQTALTARGAIALVLGALLTGFYIAIYLGDRIKLGETNLHLILSERVYSLLNPLAQLLRGQNADNWFFYGTLYTFAVVLFGVRMIWKYRHSRYQILRTISVMFFQLGFAYLIPALLHTLKQPEFYFAYFWPLKPEYFYPSTWAYYAAGSKTHAGVYFLGFAAFMSFVATPLLTYKFGKRWYCSWVCGCGGLAETLGDPFRQLSDKTLRIWKLERVLIHSVLAAVIFVTALLWLNSLLSGKVLGKFSQSLAEAYGLYIGALFSGVIGVGFYPIFGSRVWCRFGCPMAAILGFFQKTVSRFRITTNGGQCISCGNCSTYCEMGIDVRWYAQRGQNIVRSSCVGCGVCAAVCPRGVLKLENGSIFERINEPEATVLR